MSRVFARFPCRLATEVVTQKGSSQGDIINIGAGGALLRLRGKLDEGQKVRLRAKCDGETFEIDTRVLRDNGPDSRDSKATLYGLTFMESTQRMAGLLVDRVRQHAPPSHNVPLKDYW